MLHLCVINKRRQWVDTSIKGLSPCLKGVMCSLRVMSYPAPPNAILATFLSVYLTPQFIFLIILILLVIEVPFYLKQPIKLPNHLASHIATPLSALSLIVDALLHHEVELTL